MVHLHSLDLFRRQCYNHSPLFNKHNSFSRGTRLYFDGNPNQPIFDHSQPVQTAIQITMMSKQHHRNTQLSPNQQLLKSFYQRSKQLSHSPDSKSTKSSMGVCPKQSHNRSSPTAHTPLTKTLRYGNQYEAAYPPRPCTFPPATSPVPTVHKGKRNNPLRPDIVDDLKKVLDRPKKQFTSPRSIDEAPVTKREEQTLKINDKREIFFQKKEDISFNVKGILTAEQYIKFGDRFPQKFKRVGLLGRGGFSVVWLGIHKASKRRIAIKQIQSKNPHETHLKQIWFCSYFFQKGGQPREQFQDAVGINNICRLYTFQIEKQDSWLYYELCQQSLGSSLFDLKAQTNNGQRLYRIEYGELLQRMKHQEKELKKVVVEVAKALTLLNSHNIVHSDLKTQNIMLKTKRGEHNHQDTYIRSVKLIDFGSSFLFTNLRQFSMATPQYMPPEILNYILFQNSMEHDPVMLQKMNLYKNPWTIDIWSLGCILLEIVSGIPLWMSVKTRTPSQQVGTGLFAVKNRVFSKIIQKQIQVVKGLDFHLIHHNYSGIVLGEELRKALFAMLSLDPLKRISPWQLLQLLGVPCPQPTVPSF